MFPSEVTSICLPINLCTNCCDSAGKHHAVLEAHDPPETLAHWRRELLALWCQQRSGVTGSISLSRHDGCTSPELHSYFPNK